MTDQPTTTSRRTAVPAAVSTLLAAALLAAPAAAAEPGTPTELRVYGDTYAEEFTRIQPPGRPV